MNITKFCNIFSEDIEAKNITVRSGLASHSIKDTIDKIKKKKGGLWVGGKFTISEGGFNFYTNTMNKAAHISDADISFDLSEIKKVWRDFGWVSGIINLQLENQLVRVRCFGAKKVAREINGYLKISSSRRER